MSKLLLITIRRHGQSCPFHSSVERSLVLVVHSSGRRGRRSLSCDRARFRNRFRLLRQSPPMVPFRPPNSPASWMYIADSQRMRKVKVDGRTIRWGSLRHSHLPRSTFAPPVVNSIDDFETAGSWVPSGTAGALSTISRFASTLDSVVYDVIGYCPYVFGGAPIITGWASISIGGLRPTFGTNGIHAGMTMTIFQTGGGNPSEEFIVHEVIPPVQTTIGAIQSISYDDFPVQVGYCTITLNLPPTIVRSRLGYNPEMDSTPDGASVTRTPTADAIGIRPNSILVLDALNFRGSEGICTRRVGIYKS